MTDTAQSARLDGRAVEVVVGEVGISIDARLTSWLDVDDVQQGDHKVTLVLSDGTPLTLTHLGQTCDRFMDALRRARRAVRLPALTIATGDPLFACTSRAPGAEADVLLFPAALVVEPRSGLPVPVPLPLIEDVEREGYAIRLHCRAIDDVTVRALGQKTDEFLDRLARARRALVAATHDAYTQFDPALEGFSAPDGWAITRSASPAVWQVLNARAGSGERSAEIAVLAELAGDDLRFGVYTEGGAHPLPFALAPVGGRVAVEAIEGDDRATYVFATDDVDGLNAVLLLTSFRREALSLPDDELGRWAVAVRTSAAVRAARSALVARVVHNAAWEQNVRSALTTAC